jgi:tetratricopeptide (TPR) repeat protein
MIVAGLAKEYQLFAPAFAYVKNTFRSNRFVVAMLSAIGGVLPIEGRVTVSAGLLDTIAPKEGKGREKLGIVDYLATHHYYLWSPLEKTIIIPMSVFALSYLQVMQYLWPLLLVTLIYTLCYIKVMINEEDVEINKATNSKDKPKDVTFDLGRAYFYAGIYDKALEYYEKYRVEKHNAIDAKLKPMFDMHVEWATNAKRLIAEDNEVTFTNMFLFA